MKRLTLTLILPLVMAAQTTKVPTETKVGIRDAEMDAAQKILNWQNRVLEEKQAHIDAESLLAEAQKAMRAVEALKKKACDGKLDEPATGDFTCTPEKK